MIYWLDVRNFLLIKHVELTLEPGMTVLTGETGAGKSVVVDALSTLLGDRVNADVIRRDQDEAELQAAFDLSNNPAAREWLATQELESDGECVLRRVISRDRPSRGFVNGRVVPIQHLRQIGQLLVDIHGQNEHHALLNRENQRSILDEYGDLTNQVAKVGDTYDQMSALLKELESLRTGANVNDDREALLRHHIAELEALATDDSEYDQLGAEQSRLSHIQELVAGATRLIEALDESDQGNALALLSDASRELSHLGEFDARLGPMTSQIEEASVIVSETVNDIRRIASEYELDPERLAVIESRLSAIHGLARKHAVGPGELPQRLETLTTELGELEAQKGRAGEIEAEIARLQSRYDERATKLSEARQKSAKQLQKTVNAQLKHLGFPDGELVVDIKTRENNQRSKTGRDRVEFRVRTNKGQDAGPLGKIASGGELSRISLAIAVCSSNLTSGSCNVYDEVDVGIGGAIAETVGARLREISERQQVVCVTHLPQVAAQGVHHKRVVKSNVDGGDIKVSALSREERTLEIARMLSGQDVTDQAKSYAEEMLGRSEP